MAPECVFQPRLLDLEAKGASEQLFNAINESDVDLRKALYEHIILSGGTTMFPGFPTRLEKDLRTVYQQKVLNKPGQKITKVKISVEDPPRRKYFVFTGGSVLADVGKNNAGFWVTKKDWKEKGADFFVK
jgi:actin-related protein 2